MNFDLPKELIYYIFSYFDYKDLINYSLICKHKYDKTDIIEINKLWKKLCIKYFTIKNTKINNYYKLFRSGMLVKKKRCLKCFNVINSEYIIILCECLVDYNKCMLCCLSNKKCECPYYQSYHIECSHNLGYTQLFSSINKLMRYKCDFCHKDAMGIKCNIYS